MEDNNPDRTLTEDEWDAVNAMRAAHAIVGGEKPAPYDITGMAGEIVSLRQQIQSLKATLRAHEGHKVVITYTSVFCVTCEDSVLDLAEA